MAVNPLYRDEFYFFSNMYDDSLITDFYRKISAESYERSVLYQQNMLGRKLYSSEGDIFYQSTLGAFQVDKDYNNEVGLPVGSLTLTIDTMTMPYHSKRRFFYYYGVKYQMVPVTDFLSRNDVFDRSVTILIGKYRVMHAYVINNPGSTVTIAIPNSNTDGILTDYFDTATAEYSEDEPVWIFTERITQTYYADTTFATAVSTSTTSGVYDVTIDADSNINSIGEYRLGEVSNTWDCIISVNPNNYGRHLMVSTPCTLKSTSSSGVVFQVDTTFMDMIKANGSSFSVFFINRPTRRNIIKYSYDSETVPILNLDYIDNPTGNINIEVFELDSSTMCKGRKLYNPEFVQLYFPNIFDFSELNTNNSDLLIEITEYSSMETAQVMQNSLKPLIDSLGSDVYTEYVVNEYDNNFGGDSIDLKNYHPTYFKNTFEDYMNSEYYGNFRGYILDNIEKTMESDPYLVISYYRYMQNLNKKVVTLSGTPKTLRFGTGKSGEFTGVNDMVDDTSFVSSIKDDIQYFDETQSYMSYYTSMDECPANLFINGRYVRVTARRFYNGMNYIFYPVADMNTVMSEYSSDTDIVNACPITLDVYPNTYVSLSAAPKNQITIDDMSSVYKLLEDCDFTLDEIVIYDTTTGEYLGDVLDLFEVVLNVKTYIIESDGTEDEVTLAKSESYEYLRTLLAEIYETMDYEPILISGDETELNLNDFLEDMENEGVITEEEEITFTHKILSSDDVDFIPKDEDLFGKTISIYSRNYKSEWVTTTDKGTYDSSTDTTTYSLLDADLDSDLTRYMVFVDGYLVHNKNCEIISDTSTYGGNFTLNFKGDLTGESKEIILLHMPISYVQDNFDYDGNSVEDTDENAHGLQGDYYVFYMGEADTSNLDTPSSLWAMNEASYQTLLSTARSTISLSLPVEDECNLKFDTDGKRLPPMNASTYSLYGMYYNNDRGKIVLGDPQSETYLYYISGDYPITELALQNPFCTDNYDESTAVNPLDKLRYYDSLFKAGD